jgi:hypothetical protein
MSAIARLSFCPVRLFAESLRTLASLEALLVVAVAAGVRRGRDGGETAVRRG